jgi:type I restriction enzyme S subunit
MSKAAGTKDGVAVRRFKPYPAYKGSGIEWLGKVPDSWEMLKLKHFAVVNFSSVDKHSLKEEKPVLLCNYTDVYYNDYITPEKEYMKATATPSEIERFSLKKGDVLVTKDSEDWSDIAVSAYVTSDMDGVLCGYHLAHIRPHNNVFGKYLFRAFSARGINDQFRVEATGITRYGLGKYGLDNALFPVPPFETQRVIAVFLDRETERIDQLIAKKERQIELLQEKRSALISHAVTKGLNPKVKMKDSGVEWLGEIPEHWKIMAIKFTLAMPITDGPHETPDFMLEGIPFLSAESVKNDRLDFDRKRGFISEEDHARFSKKYVPKRGDVYMVKSGATTGNVARVETDEVFNIWSPLAVLRPHPGHISTDFLFYFMKSRPFRVAVELAWSYGTQQNIGMGVVSNLKIAIPSVVEQNAIAAALNEKTAQIDVLLSKVRGSIEKLNEYRTALISAAVTGKIDIREEVA